jgi:hypothetical protein
MAIMGLAEGIERLAQRAKLVKFLLIVGLAVIAASLVGQIAELRGTISLEESAPLTGAAAAYIAAGLADLLLTLVTVVFFSMWIYRAAANIVAAGTIGFDYTPGWAVGWFFVPIANLFKPYAAMRQIWNASHGGQGDELERPEGLLAIWWGTWVLANIASNIALRLTINPASPAELKTGQQIGIFASLVSLALYPAAYRLVDRITTAQRERLTSAHIFS